MKPQALVVQKRTPGLPNSSATKTEKLITPSAVTHVTEGTPDDTSVALLSLLIRCRGVWRGKAVGDSLEAEGGAAAEGVRATGLEEVAMVELGVDEGHMEAYVVKDSGGGKNSI
ncbi:hypothetical protein Acr_04g0005820 [Actinidia rufa]|uniref:Uncharacterized protein n=1 Tax=Actinidia rufa TaxID=165716 RepID=A0A7J0EH85_9ERIC|nr:hypothetical protein Acr_04g0005820 [Actinidia rufa]